MLLSPQWQRTSAHLPKRLRLDGILLLLAGTGLCVILLISVTLVTVSAWREIQSPIRAPILKSVDDLFLRPDRVQSQDKDHGAHADTVCTNSTDDLLVTVKTGASVLYQRALVHLDTTLHCVPHTLVVSDMDVDVGRVHAVDVIKDLGDPKQTLRLQDYEAYREQQDLARNHRNMDRIVANHDAWDLDKYKFIPMLYRAWKAKQPDTKWFVFMEADTLIEWDNLRVFLDRHDAREELYFGAPVWINDEILAHGGSGFILSLAAMDTAVGSNPEAWLQSWGPRAQDECCGDYLLARALKSFNITLTGAWPLVQGDPPQLAPVLPEFWCRPVVTMHHVSTQQIADIWSVAQEHELRWRRSGKARDGDSFFLWKDMYRVFVQPNIKQFRLDWDNGSNDWTFSGSDPEENSDSDAWHSPSLCEKQCRSEPDCMQWSHRGRTCKMGRNVRLGDPVDPHAGHMDERSKKDADQHWVSGWILDRISDYEREHESCENGPNWTLEDEEKKLQKEAGEDTQGDERMEAQKETNNERK